MCDHLCFLLQGFGLRKVLLQNYLFNNKKIMKPEGPDLVGGNFDCNADKKIHTVNPTWSAKWVMYFGCVCEGGEVERDWVAVAALQCRLDREGGTKLFIDLITSTKNEKIFQESIQFAISLLEGGNTEIQVGIQLPEDMFVNVMNVIVGTNIQVIKVRNDLQLVVLYC